MSDEKNQQPDEKRPPERRRTIEEALEPAPDDKIGQALAEWDRQALEY